MSSQRLENRFRYFYISRRIQIPIPVFIHFHVHIHIKQYTRILQTMVNVEQLFMRPSAVLKC